MEEEFVLLLHSKFGDAVTERLFQKNKIRSEGIRWKNKDDQLLVKDHLNKLNDHLVLGLEINQHNQWTFDFPGWLGELNFKKSSVKRIMVIGLELHVERFDFQITYGLSDNTPIENGPRFNLDLSKPDFVSCGLDGSIIWTNLFS